MQSNDLPERLSRIQTIWSDLFCAHNDDRGEAAEIRRRLLLRYHGAVYRYLRGLLHRTSSASPAEVCNLAEELAQEFALRFLRGDFRHANPGRGRFRDFLKQALRNLATDHWRRQQQAPGALPADSAACVAAGSAVAEHMDEEFLATWREELFHHTWAALLTLEKETGQLYHTVLRCKSEHPEMHSAEMATQLRGQLGKAFSAEGMRQTLHRARLKFAELLIEEVAQSAQTQDVEELEEELRQLDLLSYCQAALLRRKCPD